MVDINKLSKFLVEAKKATYASGDENIKIRESDCSTTLLYEDNDWKYQDNYFGGEPYGGREVVFFQNKPVYMMVYYGWVSKDINDVKSVYKILQKALMLIPKDKPFRGPEKYNFNDAEYINVFTGKIANFSGEEIIKSAEGKEIYKAKYIGGLINQRN